LKEFYETYPTLTAGGMLAVRIFQNLIWLPWQLEASRVPSGLYAREVTASE